ncbi:MAG: hypothetical protein R2710_06340 [Acidimicrobiales bacterium]
MVAAFLTDHTWRLRPDTPADRALYGAMVEGDFTTWEQTTTGAVVHARPAGGVELVCPARCCSRAGRHVVVQHLRRDQIFNSNKVFASWNVVDGTDAE